MIVRTEMDDGTIVKTLRTDGSLLLTKRGIEIETSRQYMAIADARTHGLNQGWWRGLFMGACIGGSVVWAMALVLRII